MEKYIVFDIKNIEPLKLGTSINQIDSESSKSYIQGSAIRGAVIANYMISNGLRDIEAEDKKMLLKGGTEFLNCYPIYENVRLLPFIKNLFTTKDEMKQFEFTNILNLKNKNSTKDPLQKIKNIDFAKYSIKDKEIKSFNVDKISNIHINQELNEKKEDRKNKIFRYEAIKPGYTFRGIIKCDKKYLNKITNTLEKGLFYIGGSKGSGYGKCEIFNIKIESKNPELNFLKEYKFENIKELYFIATSDIILRDLNGTYLSYPKEEFIRNNLDLEDVKLEEAYIETGIFTSFNNKWGYRTTLVNGIKSGSIVKYSIKGNITVDKIEKFIDKAIGKRIQEGFGRFILLPKLDFEIISKIKEKDKYNKKIVKITDENKKQLQLIIDRIYINKLKDNIPKNVLNLQKSIGYGSLQNDILKNSQWAKFMQLMDILIGMNIKESREFLNKYFLHINDKKNNRTLINTLNNINIKNKKLEEFIKEFLYESNEKFYEDYGTPIVINGISSKITKEFMYKYRVTILKEIFRMERKENDQ